MKIYISTYHNAKNFGAALQAYALQTFLKKLNYDSELIKIKPNKIPKKNLSGFKKIITIINYIYNILKKKDIAQGEKCFEDFFKNYHKTTQEYENYEELSKTPPTDGIYLSGSDQVFNPINIKPEFFLQFGDIATRRISYAASIGVDSIPPQSQDILKKYLSSFDAISIREAYSKELLKTYTKNTINVNVDPSFLLTKEEWETISNDSVSNTLKEPYILVYAIYKPQWLNDFLRRIRKETKCKIVLVSYKNFRPIYCNKCIMNAGPREFLSLVKNAKMVISSSFHGNVFATIFEKPFYAVVNPNSPARIMSMLELFALENRILSPQTSVDFNIDYTEMKKTLKTEQEKSKNYLLSSIEGAFYNEHN